MVKKDVAVVEKALPAAIDFGADAGVGMEGADAQSFAIPFLSALQKISPQCEEADAKFIPEAKGGMLYNSVTSELYDGKAGIIFLPAAYQRRFLRWGPRGGEGAGFRGELTVEQVAAMEESGKAIRVDGALLVVDENGDANPKKCDRLADVRNHFGILVNEATGSYMRVLLSLGSTQIKKSKLLMSLLSNVKVKAASGAMVTPPTFANKVRITTVPESNDKGSWYGYKFALEGFVSVPEHYNEAREFHRTIASEGVRVNYDEPAEDSDKF